MWWIGVLEQKLGELASYIVNPIPLARREAMEGSHHVPPAESPHRSQIEATPSTLVHYTRIRKP